LNCARVITTRKGKSNYREGEKKPVERDVILTGGALVLPSLVLPSLVFSPLVRSSLVSRVRGEQTGSEQKLF